MSLLGFLRKQHNMSESPEPPNLRLSEPVTHPHPSQVLDGWLADRGEREAATGVDWQPPKGHGTPYSLRNGDWSVGAPSHMGELAMGYCVCRVGYG